MKKKTICLILAGLLLFSLNGCGQKEEVKELPESVTVQDEVTENASVDETSEETPEAVTADAEEALDQEKSDEDTLFLNVNLKNVSISKNDDTSNRYGIVDVKYTSANLDDEDAAKYPELAKTLNDISANEDAEMSEEAENLLNSYMEWETDKDSDYYLTYSNSVLRKVLRADKNVLSLLTNSYSYQGGPHGYYAIYGEAYDVESGKALSLADVVKDQSGFKKILKERLLEKYSEMVFLVDIDQYFDDLPFGGEGELCWSIDYSGVTIYFEPYEVAPYAAGLLTVRFSFEKDSAYFDEKYTEVPDEYVTPVTTWTFSYADVDGDGNEEEIDLRGTVPDESWGAYQWIWMIGDKKIEDACESFDNDSYLVKKNGKFYAYMFNTVENDYQTLSIVDIASGKELGGEYGLGNYGLHGVDWGYDEDSYWSNDRAFVNPDSVDMDSRMNVLGTYSGVKNYFVGADGLPESKDDYFRVERMGYMISPIRDIPCAIVDKDGNVLEESAVIPKDTMLRIIRTDGETMADLQAGDYAIAENDYGSEEYPYWLTEEPLDLERGTFYRVKFETVDYEMKLDGESIFDLFKGMMYAG